MDYNFVDIVEELESLIWEADEKFVENNGGMFSYTTNGVIEIIECCGIEVFNSESTDLDMYYNEEKDEYISQSDFMKFIINRSMEVINEIHNVLYKIRFKPIV